MAFSDQSSTGSANCWKNTLLLASRNGTVTVTDPFAAEPNPAPEMATTLCLFRQNVVDWKSVIFGWSEGAANAGPGGLTKAGSEVIVRFRLLLVFLSTLLTTFTG